MNLTAKRAPLTRAAELAIVAGDGVSGVLIKPDSRAALTWRKVLGTFDWPGK